MATFTNDLDNVINLVQYEEIFSSMAERHRRFEKEMTLKLAIMTGTVLSSVTISSIYDRPELILLGVSGCLIANSSFSLLRNYKKPKASNYLNIGNLSEIDIKKIKKKHRELDRYNGKLKFEPVSQFYKEDKEDVSEEFGYSSDNDLEVQFLEKELVPERIIREYELYTLKYDLPFLAISKDDLTSFVDFLETFLREQSLSHRIYFYTTHYFKRVLVKSLINYEEEITIHELINGLDIFENIDYSPEKISEFKEKLREYFSQNKKKTL